MKIIKATDYGFRIVLVVCHNPDDPHWVHRQGDVVRDAQNLPVLGSAGSVRLIDQTIEHIESDGTTCHQCRNNWDITEIVLDGLEGYTSGPDGKLDRIPDEDLAQIAFSRAARPSGPVVVGSLEGRTG